MHLGPLTAAALAPDAGAAAAAAAPVCGRPLIGVIAARMPTPIETKQMVRPSTIVDWPPAHASATGPAAPGGRAIPAVIPAMGIPATGIPAMGIPAAIGIVIDRSCRDSASTGETCSAPSETATKHATAQRATRFRFGLPPVRTGEG